MRNLPTLATLAYFWGGMKIALALRTVANIEIQGTLVILNVRVLCASRLGTQKVGNANTAERNVGTPVTLVGLNG